MLERSALGNFSPAALTAIEQGVKHPVGVVRTLEKVAFQSLDNVGGTLASQAEGLLASAAGQTGQFTITQVSLQGVTCFVLSFINHLQQIQRLQVLNQLGQPINPTNPTQPAEAPDEEGDRTCQVCRNRTAVVQQEFALVCQKASNPAQAQQGLNAICVAIAEEGRLKAIADRLVSLQKAKLDAFLDEITQTTTDTDALSQQLAQLTAELITTWDGVRYALKSRKSIKFLKWVNDLKNHANKQAVFDWHVMYEYNRADAVEQLRFWWFEQKRKGGCHNLNAIDGVNVRLKPNVPITSLIPNSYGVTESDIEINVPKYAASAVGPTATPTHFVWSTKNTGSFKNSFFPVGMSKDEIIEQCASAFANPTRNSLLGSYGTFMYEAVSESGMGVRWFDGPSSQPNINNITSVFPKY